MKRRILVSALVVLTLGLTACGSVSSDNYKKIKSGMSKDEVTDILGSADECESALGFESCQWGDEKKYISVKFAGDAVLGKSSKGL